MRKVVVNVGNYPTVVQTYDSRELWGAAVTSEEKNRVLKKLVERTCIIEKGIG
ncbi:hypothetical protein [Paenibacillus polymyxa]|uniref:hypothetical protein n=1 Tax=Paenibacillus polymyxa TaxID=1406 RepID=UPI000CD34738|nr:hypothetical protein [Paenibacillus polymyxa]AJW69154.1 hypothetical protein PPE_05360 [Paenibacillus polymyxa E681]